MTPDEEEEAIFVSGYVAATLEQDFYHFHVVLTDDQQKRDYILTARRRGHRAYLKRGANDRRGSRSRVGCSPGDRPGVVPVEQATGREAHDSPEDDHPLGSEDYPLGHRVGSEWTERSASEEVQGVVSSLFNLFRRKA